MHVIRRRVVAFAALGGTLLAGCERAPGAGDSAALTIPISYDTLANGLKVVLSRDTTAPTVGVGGFSMRRCQP